MKLRSKNLLCLGLVVASVRGASAADYGQVISAQEMDCEQDLGHRLSIRMDATGGNGLRSFFVWRSTPAGGVFRGLAAVSPVNNGTSGLFLRDERQLAFDLILKADEDFLSPARLRLPAAVLVRRDSSSNLLATPPVGTAFSLTFDLARNDDPTRVEVPLLISVLPSGSRAGGPGRIVEDADLTEACHGQVSEVDVTIESILARTVRPGCEEFSPHAHCPPYQYKAMIFRGEQPLTYRVDLYGTIVGGVDQPQYQDLRIPLLFRFQVDEERRLTSGDVQVLPFCAHLGDSNCTTVGPIDTGIFILPPVQPGKDIQGPEVLGRSTHLRLGFQGDPQAITFATINWADLLKDTTWNLGLP